MTLLKLLEEDLTEEGKYKNLITMSETLAKDNGKEKSAEKSENQTPAETKIAESKIAPQPSGGLKRVATHRNLKHVYVHLPSPDQSPEQPKRRPAPIVTQPQVLGHKSSKSLSDLHQPEIHIARPYVPQARPEESLREHLQTPSSFVKSTDSFATQCTTPKVSPPPWQASSTPTNPDPEIVDGKVIMTPYMTYDSLFKFIDQIPRKLRTLLRVNDAGYWPYIQEWYRQQREEDLDDEVIHLCEEMKLGRDLTLALWNNNIEYVRQTRMKREAKESGESRD